MDLSIEKLFDMIETILIEDNSDRSSSSKANFYKYAVW